MKNIFVSITILMFLAGCKNGTDPSDAFGNFESEPVLVAAESQGVITSFALREGDKLQEGMLVGLIDTMQLHLKKEQLKAGSTAVRARIASADAQIATSEVQLDNLNREARRIRKLFEDGAATEKQKDDMQGALRVMQAQLEVSKRQKSAVVAELRSIDAQVRQVEDQLSNATITNPVQGVVLQKYKMQGEIVAPGQILYKIARMDPLILRAYISGNQLSEVQTGQQITVRFDVSEGIAELPGKVTWIASEAEFTPRIIQTREERVNLVYAMKVEVKNDGRLKIGMPGEVKFQ